MSDWWGASRLSRIIHARRLPAAVRLAGWFMAALVLAAAIVASVQRQTLEYDLIARENTATVQALTRLTEAVLATTEAVLATAVSAVLATEGVTPGPGTQDLLLRLKAEVPFLRTLLILDPQGRVVADGRENAPALGMDVSDRRYFQVHAGPANPAGDKAYLDQAIASRVDGKWSLPISRAVRDAEGRLVGVLVTSLDVDFLIEAFAEAAIDSNVGVVLARLDGPVLARWPNPEAGLGTSIAGSRLLTEAGQGSLSGRFQAVSPIDGVRRVVEYKRLPDYPVVLAVGRREAVFLELMARELLPWLVIAALGVVAFPVGGMLIARAIGDSRLAMERAERADDRKTQFLANTSHELRTPLNAILGYAEILRDDLFQANIPQRYREYAGSIHDSGDHLLSIVNDLLDLNTLLRGDVPMAESKTALTEMLGNAVQLAGLGSVGRRGIEQPDPATLSGFALVCDERRTVQAIVNLLANAIRHTPPDAYVGLVVTAGPPGLIIAVEDGGPGIPTSVLRQLGEPFPISGDSYVSGSHGTGLGLAITHRIMTLQGGVLVLSNRAGGGARAELHFPEARVVRGASSAAGD